MCARPACLQCLILRIPSWRRATRLAANDSLRVWTLAFMPTAQRHSMFWERVSAPSTRDWLTVCAEYRVSHAVMNGKFRHHSRTQASKYTLILDEGTDN